MTYKDIHLKRRVKKFSSAFCVENDEKLNKTFMPSPQFFSVSEIFSNKAFNWTIFII